MNIKIDEMSGVLACPHCGEGYLHHQEVQVFSRSEDAEVTRVTTVHGDDLTSKLRPSAETRNPSSRRDGVTIRFYCEHGCNDSYLTIAQHKGGTIMKLV